MIMGDERQDYKNSTGGFRMEESKVMVSQTPKEVRAQNQPNQRPQFDMDSRVQQPGQNDENYKPLSTTHVTTHSTPASQPLGGY